MRSSLAERPIGVFDSGLGGLTIVREIRRELPQESIVYFGDLARLPYGTKSREQIIRYSVENAEFLLQQSVKVIIIACHSSSSAAYSALKKKFSVPVIDVIQPASEEAALLTRKGRIGVIGTQATVETGAYERILKRLAKVRVFSRPCPMFVPLVEEGWLAGAIPDKIVEHYLAPLKRKGIDVLMLGCTHYPILRKAIKAFMNGTTLVDSARATVQKLSMTLHRLGLKASSKSKKGFLKIYVSDKPRNFIKVGEQFLGENLGKVEVIRNHG